MQCLKKHAKKQQFGAQNHLQTFFGGLGSLSEGLKIGELIKYLCIFTMQMCVFFRKKWGHPGRGVKSNQLKKWSNFTWWFWNPIRWPNLTQPDGLTPPMEAMVFWIILGSDDSFARISYSSLMARTDDANIPRWETIFLMNMFLANAKKVAGGWCAWIRKEEGSLFEAGGIYEKPLHTWAVKALSFCSSFPLLEQFEQKESLSGHRVRRTSTYWTGKCIPRGSQFWGSFGIFLHDQFLWPIWSPCGWFFS